MPRGKRRSKLRVWVDRVVCAIDPKVAVGVLTACLGGGAIVHNHNEITDNRLHADSVQSATQAQWRARSRMRDARIDSLSIRVHTLERENRRYRGLRTGRARIAAAETVYVAPAPQRHWWNAINPFHAEDRR